MMRAQVYRQLHELSSSNDKVRRPHCKIVAEMEVAGLEHSVSGSKARQIWRLDWALGFNYWMLARLHFTIYNSRFKKIHCSIQTIRLIVYDTCYSDRL
jgi:hypothetical protein